MAYKDLLEWLDNVEKRGELKKFSGASWDLEMSSMCDMLQKEKKLQMPAVLFDDVPGYPKGFRTLFGITASPWRLAHTLGLPEDKVDVMSVVKNCVATQTSISRATAPAWPRALTTPEMVLKI